VVVGIAAMLIYRASALPAFDWRLMLDSVAHARIAWLLAAVLAIFATYVVRALRWALFLRPLKENPSFANLLSSTIIGYTAITVLGRPGEFVRPYLIASKEHLPVASQLAAWVLERIFDLLMALMILGFALTRVRTAGVAVGPVLAWILTTGGRVVVVAGGVLIVLVLSLRHFAEPARRWLIRVLRFLPEAQFLQMEKLVTAFVQGVESTRSDATLLLVLLYSIAEWLLIWACYWCLAAAFRDLSLTYVEVVILMGLVNLGTIIQIPGIGGGVQVVSVLVLTELFRVRLEVATAFAFMLWFFTFVIIMPVGLVLILKEGLDWQRLRRARREAVI
jgi:uncharacterized protein (TIRG00374 family)